MYRGRYLDHKQKGFECSTSFFPKDGHFQQAMNKIVVIPSLSFVGEDSLKGASESLKDGCS